MRYEKDSRSFRDYLVVEWFFCFLKLKILKKKERVLIYLCYI